MKEQLEEELKRAQARVADLRRQVDEYDDFPIGTILQLEDEYYINYAIKMDSIVRDFGCYEKSDTPVWILMFSDFSGTSYPSLAALKSGRGSQPFRVIHRPSVDAK